jgi:hypothetical protein
MWQSFGRPSPFQHYYGCLAIKRLVQKEAKINTKTDMLSVTGAIITTPTGGTEALVGLSPLDLVIQLEESLAAHRPLNLLCWCYFHRNKDTVVYEMDFRSLIPYFIWGSTL